MQLLTSEKKEKTTVGTTKQNQLSLQR